jgi:hypothetical protein
MPAIEWLRERYPDLQNVPNVDLDEVMDFLLLWSVFEGHLLNRDADADVIVEQCGAWDLAGRLRVETYDQSLEYFRRRYRPGALATLDALFRGRVAGRELVEREINGDPLHRAQRVAALFIIVFRLRNNLFHGQKIIDGLLGQRENFVHANNSLRAALDAAR